MLKKKTKNSLNGKETEKVKKKTTNGYLFNCLF